MFRFSFAVMKWVDVVTNNCPFFPPLPSSSGDDITITQRTKNNFFWKNEYTFFREIKFKILFASKYQRILWLNNHHQSMQTLFPPRIWTSFVMKNNVYRKKIVILEICKALQNVFCTIFVIILAHLFWNMYENPNRVEPFFAFKRVNDSMIFSEDEDTNRCVSMLLLCCVHEDP